MNIDALVAIRRKDGLSQAALARAAGLPRSVLCEIEGGKRPANERHVAVLAEALKVPKSAIESNAAAVA